MSDNVNKAELRSILRGQRKSLDHRDAELLSQRIQERCLTIPEWEQAKTVHVYVSAVDNEVHTEKLIDDLLHRYGYAVVPLCCTEGIGLHNIRIESRDELVTGQYGLLEPVYDQERIVSPEELELVVAPLVGFDRNGGRLGLGGGYYDSLLAHIRCPAVGIAYAMQEVKHVPCEGHDIGLDVIVTEHEIIRAGNG